MRIILVVMILLFSVCVCAEDMQFSKEASGTPELIQSGHQKEWCPICGMNLKKYYKTSHAMELSGGTNKQYCSLRCLIQDFDGLASIVKQILVVDAVTEKLIPAHSAVYVLGSKVPGTMSATSKIAFGNKEDAEKFQEKMGGKIVRYPTAVKSAKASMKNDIEMTNMKRQKMMYPKGEKIFNTVCDKSIDPIRYNLINELKSDIKANNRCGKLAEKELQAVALYLWDVVRMEEHSESFIEMTKDDNCPVCGMFVHKYPKWASKIKYTMDGNDSYVVFDGVKDMMKFYFDPAKWGYKGIAINEILVTDYYSNKAIKAENAFFVEGGDVYGPMGKELIPFDSRKHAQTFMDDHSEKNIITFSDITEHIVKGLDE